MTTPLVRELLPVPDPADCAERFAGSAHRLLLDSAARSARLGRYSFFMADPAVVVTSRDGRTTVATAGVASVVDADALLAVRRLLAPHAAAPQPGLPPFQGGAAGYVGYDWGLTLERLPAPRHDDHGLDDVVLGLYDWVIAWDHAASKAWLISTRRGPRRSPSHKGPARRRPGHGRRAAARADARA